MSTKLGGGIVGKDFIEFQKYFRGYQQRFGLTGYKVYFKYAPLEDCFASISISRNNRVATVTLNSKLASEVKPFKDIKRSAKHEAIHLLLQRLEQGATGRYVTEDEIYEAVEELTVKLEGLIPD